MSECKVERLDELKNAAQTYYSECGPGKGVIERVEHILNYTFYKQPSDIYGYLSTYFEQFCTPPSIAKIVVEEVSDIRGFPTLQADVYCLFKNDIKLVSSAVSAYTRDYELKLAAGYSREDVMRERERQVEEGRRLVNAFSLEVLRGVRLAEQCQVDQLITSFFTQMQTDAEAEVQAAAERAAEAAALTSAVDKGRDDKSLERSGSGKSKKSGKQEEKQKKKKEEAGKASPKADRKSKGRAGSLTAGGGKTKPSDLLLFIPEEPFESFYPGSIAISAVSQAVCRAAASVAAQIPAYQYINHLLNPLQSCEVGYNMPVPIFTILGAARRTGGGKLKSAKEFLLIPSPDIPITEAVRVVNRVYSYCTNELIKRNIHATNEEGILSPMFERVEEGLDLISEALTQFDLTLGTHFYLAINCAAHEIYNPTPGKYEISAGRQVTSSELVSYWSDLLQAYPHIIALIDPLRKADEEAWLTLYSTISSHCYIMADYVYGRPHTLYCDICTSGAAKIRNLRSDRAPATEEVRGESDKCGYPVVENCTNSNSPEEICTNQNAKKPKDKPEKAPDKDKKIEESADDGSAVVEGSKDGSITTRVSVVERFLSHAAILRMEHCETLSDVLGCYQLIKERCMEGVIGMGSEYTPDGFIADLAIGLGARFLYLGCISKGQSCQTLARLLQIESQLRAEGRLVELCTTFQFNSNVIPDQNQNSLSQVPPHESAQAKSKSKA